MQHYTKPCVQRNPDEIILHVGTNDLKNKTATEVTGGILRVCNIVKKESPKTNIVVLELIIRTDSTQYNKQVEEVNPKLRRYCSHNHWDYIKHKNIGAKHINT